MRYIFIILLVLAGYIAKAQLPSSTFPSRIFNGNTKAQWILLDSPVVNPILDTFNARYPGTQLVRIQGGDTAFWFGAGGHLWFRSLLSRDTISLSSRINLKLNITDTSGQWLSQATRLVDTMYRVNDSTVGYTIKGAPYTFQILGRLPSGGGGSGTVTSVGLSLPSAFSVTPATITTSGVFNVSGAGTTAQYIRGNGTLATTDTGMIPNFHLKVRGLLSASSPLTYNSTTGIFGITNANTSGTKGAATFANSDFSDNGAGLISLSSLVTAGSCTNCAITWGTDGRATAYSSGTAPTGVAVDTIYRTPGKDSIFFTINGNLYAIKDSVGGGSTFAPNNIGTGFAWLATPSGNFKRAANSNTILWDSTSTANSLTAKVDTSVIATQFDISTKLENITGLITAGTNVSITGTGTSGSPYVINSSGGSGSSSLTYKNVGYGGIGNTLSTGEASFQYDSILNKLTVDSIDLSQSRQDSSMFRRLADYLSADSIIADGNSITAGLNASPVADSAYAYRLGNKIGLVVDNIAVSGTGMVSIANRHLINKNPGNTVMSTVMGGLNDVRRNGAARKTLNKIINGYKAIFANQYLKSFTNAGTGGTGVTRNGSWVDSWDARAEGGKTTVGAYTSSTGSYIEYPFTDSVVVAGIIGGDGSASSYIGTDIEVRIDGGVVATINTNNQTDGVADGSGLDNKRCAMAFMFGGLTYASHTIRLTKLSTGGGGFMICDYFGHLVPRTQAYAMLWFHAPYLTEVGYLTAPANATNAIIDSVNIKIDSLISSDFIRWYPTRVVETNNCYDTTTGTSIDGIHPNNTGHGQIFDCAMNAINSGNGGGGATGKMYYSDEFHGIVEGVDEILLTLTRADRRYIQNQTATTQAAAYKISGAATAERFITSGTIFTGSLTNADRQTNGFVAGVASGGPVMSIRNTLGAVNASTYDWFVGSNGIEYRALSDNLATSVNYMRVILASGPTVDTIQMPKLDVTGNIKVYTHSVVADKDSAVVWNRATNEYEVAKINGGGGSAQTWQQTLTTGSTLTTNNTITGGNNSFTWDGMFNFRINANSFLQSKTGGGATYSTTVLGADNFLHFGYTPVPTVYSKGSAIIIDTNNSVGVGAQMPTTAPLYSTGLNLFANNLLVGGGAFYGVSTLTSNTTIDLNDHYIRLDATSGNITITLPAASTAFGSNMGIHYVFKRLDNSGNSITIQRAGSDTIDGGTSITLTTQYEVKELQCSSTSTWDVR